MTKKKKYFRLFTDILQENNRYSQGRVYLLWSIIAYYITLGIITIAGVKKDDIDMESFKIIIDALEYAMTLFAGYVFGGKAIEIVKALKGQSKSDSDSEEPNDADNV